MYKHDFPNDNLNNDERKHVVLLLAKYYNLFAASSKALRLLQAVTGPKSDSSVKIDRKSCINCFIKLRLCLKNVTACSEGVQIGNEKSSYLQNT